MAKSLAKDFKQGNTEFHRRMRGYFGLMAHVARLANVTQAHVTCVVAGRNVSRPVMRIAMRELAKAEAIGNFERAA
jgi:hypothetical protein